MAPRTDLDSAAVPETASRDPATKPLKTFITQDPTIARHLSVVDDAWRLDAEQTQTVRLFELHNPEVGPGAMFYHADLRTEEFDRRVYLGLDSPCAALARRLASAPHLRLRPVRLLLSEQFCPNHVQPKAPAPYGAVGAVARLESPRCPASGKAEPTPGDSSADASRGRQPTGNWLAERSLARNMRPPRKGQS